MGTYCRPRYRLRTPVPARGGYAMRTRTRTSQLLTHSGGSERSPVGLRFFTFTHTTQSDRSSIPRPARAHNVTIVLHLLSKAWLPFWQAFALLVIVKFRASCVKHVCKQSFCGRQRGIRFDLYLWLTAPRLAFALRHYPFTPVLQHCSKQQSQPPRHDLSGFKGRKDWQPARSRERQGSGGQFRV